MQAKFIKYQRTYDKLRAEIKAINIEKRNLDNLTKQVEKSISLKSKFETKQIIELVLNFKEIQEEIRQKVSGLSGRELELTNECMNPNLSPIESNDETHKTSTKPPLFPFKQKPTPTPSGIREFSLDDTQESKYPTFK